TALSGTGAASSRAGCAWISHAARTSRLVGWIWRRRFGGVLSFARLRTDNLVPTIAKWVMRPHPDPLPQAGEGTRERSTATIESPLPRKWERARVRAHQPTVIPGTRIAQQRRMTDGETSSRRRSRARLMRDITVPIGTPSLSAASL